MRVTSNVRVADRRVSETARLVEPVRGGGGYPDAGDRDQRQENEGAKVRRGWWPFAQRAPAQQNQSREQRDAFQHESDVSLGTTNVDYSWRLYEHFQTIRSYRETRFTIDPHGFEVQTNESGDGNYREEKIDLPQSWLRGFATLQSAMSLPASASWVRPLPLSPVMM